jgi:hypothetical protein
MAFKWTRSQILKAVIIGVITYVIVFALVPFVADLVINVSPGGTQNLFTTSQPPLPQVPYCFTVGCTFPPWLNILLRFGLPLLFAAILAFGYLFIKRSKKAKA